jgi:HK97 gp10 family phage protein
VSLVEFKVAGDSQLQAQLVDLGAELGAKALAQAVRQAFKPVLETAKEMVPVDSGDLRDALRLSVKKPNSGDTVVVVGLRIGGGAKLKGIAAIAQKYASHFGGERLPPARRWHWVELGTANMAAHPYLRPALDQNAGKVLELLKSELVKSIEKALKKKAAKDDDRRSDPREARSQHSRDGPGCVEDLPQPGAAGNGGALRRLLGDHRCAGGLHDQHG